jgi:N-acetylglucosamine-6-phosphate deacetylase
LDDHLISDIVPVQTLSPEIPALDLGGQILAPGFIDVQVNGGGGILFNEHPAPDAVRIIASAHRQFGTTGLLPTPISDDLETMAAAADAVRQLAPDPREGILGIHFEGPYLNPERKGVHDSAKIRAMEKQGLEFYCTKGLGTVIVTVAPETLPANTIRHLSDAGVVVSAGHTAATFEDITGALQEGLRGFTHLYNAMSPLQSRAPGVVGAALASKHSWCSIIVDGHHVHKGALEIALRAKPRGKMILITDAMPCVGTSGKGFQLQSQSITVKDGRCLTKDGTLAGAALDMMTAVKNMVDMGLCDLPEALRMASLYPSEYLGLEQKYGRIRTGYQADLVAFDTAFRVRQTWIAGSHAAH